MRDIDKAVMKERFHEAFHKASEAGVVKTGTDFGSTYTMSMLRALKDMAEHDVWPDGRFGDDDCNVWSLFRRYGVKKLREENGELSAEIKELRKENTELSEDLGRVKGKYAYCLHESGKLYRELDAQKRVNSEISKQNAELLLEREALKADVERLKYNLSVLSSALHGVLLFTDGLDVDDDGVITSAETGEVLSE